MPHAALLIIAILRPSEVGVKYLLVRKVSCCENDYLLPELNFFVFEFTNICGTEVLGTLSRRSLNFYGMIRSLEF